MTLNTSLFRVILVNYLTHFDIWEMSLWYLRTVTLIFEKCDFDIWEHYFEIWELSLGSLQGTISGDFHYVRVSLDDFGYLENVTLISEKCHFDIRELSLWYLRNVTLIFENCHFYIWEHHFDIWEMSLRYLRTVRLISEKCHLLLAMLTSKNHFGLISVMFGSIWMTDD